MTKPTLVNWKFWSFQWKSSWLKGFKFNQVLPTNEFFFYSVENFYLSFKHIDLIIWYLKWKLKKSGSFRFVYPCDFPLTKKPTEVRMGKGKGAIVDWSIPIKKGVIFLKLVLKNPILITSIKIFLLKKLPFLCKSSYSIHSISELNTKNYFSNISKLPHYQTILNKWFIVEQN